MARAVIDLYDVEQRLDAGESVQAIAADLGVTPRTIRNRRARITSELRKVALAA